MTSCLVPSFTVHASTESATNAVVFIGDAAALTDANGASWTIVSGVVKRDGVKASYSARVIAIAYVNHVVWQENADKLWWSWNGKGWSGGTGTSQRPFMTSADYATATAGTGNALVDANRSVWTIASGVAKKDGASAAYSARVTTLAYINGVVWQENADKLWWSWNGQGWSGGTGIAMSPFAGQTLYTVSSSHAQTQATLWQSSQPTNAIKMTYLGAQPTAVWFGDWNIDVERDVRQYVDGAEAAMRLPVLVAYAIPNRDCGSGFSAGGVNDASDYHDWITQFANGIGSRSATVILEPDAVALDCFTSSRAAMMRDAVTVLEAKPNVSIYIDAGHPNWTSANTMATRLQEAGIASAQGFALNVSNFYSTSSNVAFGDELSAKVGGKHYIIDTSRNANGWQGEWCNPQGAGIGSAPTVNTGEPLIDAFLWVKPPGESDGNCNGGPSAGSFWSEYAVKLYDQGKH